MSEVRVRFAPSPTGALHLGGLRTALFNWLFARRHGGAFILRIEDTDRDRSMDEAIESIVEGLRWTGLEWDEGPCRQTDRLDLYRDKAAELVERGLAYWCVCAPDELDARRKAAQARGESVKYDGRCRTRGIIAPATPAAIRLRAPHTGHTVVEDLIKGPIVFDNAVLDDLILLRSNGYPTYHLSVVIDDALMGITHVIRGDDHVNNTPRQAALFAALGCPAPRYAHVPMILGADKTRLSKRHGAASVLAYRDMGYVPDALVNYLVRLGWSHGDQEMFSMRDMIEKFSLERVQSSAAVFNPDKLQWLNAAYVKQSAPAQLAAWLRPFLERRGCDSRGPVQPQGGLEAVVPHLRDRAKTLVDMAEWATPYFTEPVVMDPAAAALLTPETAARLATFAERVKTVEPFSKDAVAPVVQALLREERTTMGAFAQPLRAALTGRTFSPGIYEVMELLGRERTLRRIDHALRRMSPS